MPLVALRRPIPRVAMKEQAGITQDQAATTKKQDELAHAVLDLSCFDWLNFPHWNKVCWRDGNGEDYFAGGPILTKHNMRNLYFS